MATQAKLAGNARYLAKMKTLTIRIDPGEYEKLKADAINKNGGSVQGYILQATRERMTATQGEQPEEVETMQDGERVKISINAAALEAIQQLGETPAQAAARIIKKAIEAERQNTNK